MTEFLVSHPKPATQLDSQSGMQGVKTLPGPCYDDGGDAIDDDNGVKFKDY